MVQNSASRTDWRPIARSNVFLTKLMPLLRDPYVIRAQIACHTQPFQIAQKSGFVHDPYAILAFGLCDRAFTYSLS